MDALSPDQYAAEAHATISAARATSAVRGAAAARTGRDGDTQAAPFVAPRTALISDALLEPLLVEAQHRRASYLGGRFPIVSVLLLLLILCVGWLS